MANLILGPVIGGLSSSRTNLWGRADSAGLLHAWLGHLPDLCDAALVGTSLPLSAEDGFAGVVALSGLQPDSLYFYTLTLSPTPPKASQGPYSQFQTFPLEGTPSSFAFAFGSCFRPADANGGQIFKALDARRRQDNLRFLLLIGDQIYADAWTHNGIGKIATTLDEYRRVYAYTWSRPAFRALLASLPAFMILDDHEVDDDWRWLDRDRQWAFIPWWDRLEPWWKKRPPQEQHIPRMRVLDALQAYWEHQAMHAPALLLPPALTRGGQYDLDWSSSGALAYTFNFGAAAFFVLDLRTQRVRNSQERLLMGENQWQALEAWFVSVKDTCPVKFIVTSSACLFNIAVDIPQDRWPGFRQDRTRFLNLIAKHAVKDLYLLAGDLHSAHAVRADLHSPGGETIPVWEFCASPFEQDPNGLAQYTYWPLHDASILRQERKFTIAKKNFGLVRVDFGAAPSPTVRYEVYGETGNLLAQV